MHRTRAWRRHHIERLKRKRRTYWGGRASDDARSLRRVTRTPRPCSCLFCGNPRRWWGERTAQERRMEEPLLTLRFEEWEAQKMRDPGFVAAAQALEPEYQATVLELRRKRANEVQATGLGGV